MCTDAYYLAARTDTDTKVATNTLETIRRAMKDKDLLEVWDEIDNQIALVVTTNLIHVLGCLREKFEELMMQRALVNTTYSKKNLD